MIVRKPHPADPGRTIFVPLQYEHQTGKYVAIESDGRCVAFINEDEARRFAFEHARAEWGNVRRLCRILRLMSEHPNFRFMRDGIDDELVRHEARSLTKRVEKFDWTLTYLLSQPGDEDIVKLDVDALVVQDE